jgi:CelD/BcsL family acetyltransferase involved in cellulose biosynthesis
MTAPVECQVHVTAVSAAEWPQVSQLWERLAGASPHTSFFLTTAWMETWLQSFADVVEPSLLVFESGGAAVGACVIVASRRRRALLGFRRLSLNAAGEPDDDTTYIEFNTLLCHPGWEEPVAAALLDHLRQSEWDELSLDGFCECPGLATLQQGFADLAPETSVRPSYYVDLGALRRSPRAYEDDFGSTTRKHLRQNLRYYAKRGPLRVDAAVTLSEALDRMERLADLHQQRWVKRGRPGAFASTRFRSFHGALIRRVFSSGAIQLLRVSAGDETVGVLYNFVYRGKVYFYQSGFRYEEDGRSSPGMVTLYHAVQYCRDAGFDEFDFLAGDDLYKRSLSTGSRPLVWVVFRKPRLKFHVLGWLRRLKGLAERQAAHPG